jgi:excisionase family DNA binding protein
METSTDTNLARTPLLSEYSSPAELASELRISQRTLDRWVSIGEGPPRVTIGRKVLYRRDAVAAWMRSRERKPVAA